MSRVEVLESRIFGPDDQRAFAEMSGDWNPIHVDPVDARRSQSGQVVHGVHAVLWAIDRYLSSETHQGIARISASFLQPIRLREQVQLWRQTATSDALLTIQKEESTLVSIRVTPGPERYSTPSAAPHLAESKVARERDRSEAAADKGEIELWGDAGLLTQRFPNLAQSVGTLRLSTLLALSRLVGMHCPGLHSLFASLDVQLVPQTTGALRFEALGQTRQSEPLKIAVAGGGMSGQLRAFVRPPPTRQVEMQELHDLVEPGEFAQQRALIVGGSRGLGEVTAKIVAAGGGLPILTYHVGRADAETVARAIRAANRSCHVVQATVQDTQGLLENVAAAHGWPSHIYYFASPAILFNRRLELDNQLLSGFLDTYVASFLRLCRSVPARHCARVFYPSTSFLNHPALGLAEYVIAKGAGEACCRYLQTVCPNLSIVVRRLPRLHTDQTNSFLGGRAPDPAPAMLEVVRAMNGSPTERGESR